MTLRYLYENTTSEPFSSILFAFSDSYILSYYHFFKLLIDIQDFNSLTFKYDSLQLPIKLILEGNHPVCLSLVVKL